jgi:predicted nucleic acid-binding protein
VIVDTSAIIELLRNTGSAVHKRLERALKRTETVLIPSVVLQEVLQGARSLKHFADLELQMEMLRLFEPEDSIELHRHAAMLYARCRWQGLTPRSPIDCIVAACALEAGVPLLANDRDFAVIASIEPRLKLIP